jgi:hypothetical protein
MPMVFPTSPTVGQVFTSGGRSWVWSGATWDSPTATNTLLAPYGLELITSQSFSTQSAVQVNYCFSSKFDNYKVVFNNLFMASGDGAQISWQLVSGTSPVSTNTYHSQRLYAQSASVGGSQAASQTSASVGFLGSANSNFITMEISSPFLVAQTKSISQTNYAPVNIDIHYARNQDSTSYDGIRFILASSTMTGNVKIYGYRNEL